MAKKQTTAKGSPKIQGVLVELGEIHKEYTEVKSKFEELEKRRIKAQKEIEKLPANQRQLFDNSLTKYVKKGKK